MLCWDSHALPMAREASCRYSSFLLLTLRKYGIHVCLCRLLQPLSGAMPVHPYRRSRGFLESPVEFACGHLKGSPSYTSRHFPAACAPRSFPLPLPHSVPYVIRLMSKAPYCSSIRCRARGVVQPPGGVHPLGGGGRPEEDGGGVRGLAGQPVHTQKVRDVPHWF